MRTLRWLRGGQGIYRRQRRLRSGYPSLWRLRPPMGCKTCEREFGAPSPGVATQRSGHGIRSMPARGSRWLGPVYFGLPSLSGLSCSRYWDITHPQSPWQAPSSSERMTPGSTP